MPPVRTIRVSPPRKLHYKEPARNSHVIRYGHPGRRTNLPESPLILVVEDEYPLQGVVEAALIDGGFAADNDIHRSLAEEILNRHGRSLRGTWKSLSGR